jgi:outer membrane protein OmpA-like peptidoglycan-associated protein
MRNLLIVLGTVATLAAGTVAAESASKEENVGVGAGVIVGAVAGGPAGAIIGAAIGAKLGDTFRRRGDEVDTLDQDLRTSRVSLKQLEKDLVDLSKDNVSLERDLEEMRAEARPELLSLLQAGIEMDLLFRTDEHVLSGTTDERLKAMAVTLSSLPDVSIRLDGFADERGDAGYNQNLSRMRADHVRDVLVSSGIPSARIKVNANGESPAADKSVDSYALERRVSLTLFVEESTAFASNPVN